MSAEPSSKDYELAAKAPVKIFRAPQLPYQPPRPKKYRAKIGLIGCGGITASHLKAYSAMGWDVVGFHDIDEARATEKRDTYYPTGAVYKTLDELLARPEIDVVDIATHPTERVPLIEAALKAGKHVLSHKPFVLDLREGQRLIELAEKQGLYLAVNHNARWAPHFSYIRQGVQQGLIGPVGSLVVSISWDHTWTKGTPFERIQHLLLYDFGIHWFDLVCQVFKGQRPMEVSTSLRTAIDQPIAPPLIGTVRIAFEHGFASLNFHANCTGGGHDTTIVTGNDGILMSQGPSLGVQKVRLQNKEGAAAVRLRGNWFREGFQGTMGELLTAIEQKRQPSNSAVSAMDGLALCFAAIESATTGKAVVPGTVMCAPEGCFPN